MTGTEPSDRADLLKQVERWAGSKTAALAWYRCERIPSLGDRTPEELVNQGRSDEVRAYPAHLADDGYA